MSNYKVITSINLIDREKWDEFVCAHPNGNFFQTPSAFDLFSDFPDYEPLAFFAQEDNSIKGVLVAVIMKEVGLPGYFSRRCIIWGGPLCYDNDTANRLLFELNKSTSNKTIYTEFRNLFDTSNYLNSFEDQKYSFINWLNYIVKIDSIEGNKKKLNDSKKRQISKSIKTGVKIIEAQSIDQVKILYDLLVDLYKEKIKKPLPSFQFFEKFFLSQAIGKIFIIENGNKIVGGAVCPVYKDWIYEFYVCGLDREIKNVYPSALATWAPIEYAAKNGLKYFDFMGAGSPEADYGVREFKSQFGGDLYNFGRYIRINNQLLYRIGKLGLKIYASKK